MIFNEGEVVEGAEGMLGKWCGMAGRSIDLVICH